MFLNGEQESLLRLLVQHDSNRGMTSGELRVESRVASEQDVETALSFLIAYELVEKRDQTSDIWPSQRPAQSLRLVGGQIRPRAYFRATMTGMGYLKLE